MSLDINRRVDLKKGSVPFYLKAMILAAGRGERMRPLTDIRPKCLLEVAGKPLIVYHLEKLAQSGINQVVINHAWLGAQIKDYLKDGRQYGLTIDYSDEPHALETAGGIINALDLLGDEPFLVINADVWTDFDFAKMPAPNDDVLAHLLLVPNPEHNVQGDFSLDDSGRLRMPEHKTFTYSGIGLYKPELFASYAQGKRPLHPVLVGAIKHKKISAEVYHGLWSDIGTVERLARLEKILL